MQVNVIDNKGDNRYVMYLLPDFVGQFALLPESPMDMPQEYNLWPKVDGRSVQLDENEILGEARVQVQGEAATKIMPCTSGSPRSAVDEIEEVSSEDAENFLIAFSQVPGE